MGNQEAREKNQGTRPAKGKFCSSIGPGGVKALSIFQARGLKTWLRAGRVAQVVEHPPSKCEALSSNSNNTKKKKTCSMKHPKNSDVGREGLSRTRPRLPA
jgi:hypothetical protein